MGVDFISLLSQRRVVAKSEFQVEGEAEAPQLRKSTTTPMDGYIFKLAGPSQGVFPAGEEAQLQLSILPEGESEGLEFGLVMGAYAHLVVFDEAGKGFAHLQPKNPFVEQQDSKNPDLNFSFFPADPGKYRLWAQLMVDGQERFVPFDLEVF